MTIRIRLSAETASRLERLARRRVATKSQLVREGLELLPEREATQGKDSTRTPR